MRITFVINELAIALMAISVFRGNFQTKKVSSSASFAIVSGGFYPTKSELQFVLYPRI